MSFRPIALASLAVLSACGPQMVEPELVLAGSPRTIDNLNQKTVVRAIATDSKMGPGTGTVRFSTPVGSLKNGAEVPLAAGEAITEFTCSVAADPGCTGGSVRITAEWVADGKLREATLNINVVVGTVDSGTPDAGMMPVDSGTPDAGMDAGVMATITVTSSKTQVIAGVGDSATLTATVQSAGMIPLPNTSVVFSTSAGRLGPVGGSPQGTMFTATTDAMGQAQVLLVAATGDQGPANVTATVGASSGMASVGIVNVSQASYIGSQCQQTTTNCTLMGIQGSGFNETASVRFKVVDSAGVGVPAVPVNFALLSAPNGTTVEPNGVTNAMGEVTATVRSGIARGSFSVRLSTLNDTITVTSTTIGVRAAKASNRGFALNCARKNVAPIVTFVEVACTIDLIDRLGNAVGTGTQVLLNSESGVVDNTVATQAYTPVGSNTNEGKGSFIFSTRGNNTPVDVPPLLADPAQVPFPRSAEPSVSAGTLVRNPRDGLVTIIAYLQGEEDFKDDNSNGVRDGNEQFIDQGEPFVDANDNNVWEPGEFLVDSPLPDGGVGNGIWDGPNGTWDSNTQIWTETRVLVTGAASPSTSMITLNPTRTGGGTYGTVPLAGTTSVNLFLADQNLNRVEGGSTVAARFVPQLRGSISAQTTLANDEYGFGYARRLVTPAGAVCQETTPADPICRWRTEFSTWSEGAAGSLLLIGNAAPSVPTVQQLIVDVSTRGTVSTVTATGTVE